MSFYYYMNKKTDVKSEPLILINTESVRHNITMGELCDIIQHNIKKRTKWERLKIWYQSRFTKVGKFTTYISPVIKNISPSVLAPDLIDVQPMNVPSSVTFYMDYVKAKPTRWQLFKIDVKIWCLMVKLWFSTKFSKF